MREIRTTGETNTPYVFITDATNFEEVLPVIRESPMLAVDTETTGLDPHNSRIVMLQLGTRQGTYVIDVRQVPILLAKDLLENPRSLKLLQNAKFDYQQLKAAGIQLNNVYDTMLAEGVLCSGMRPQLNLAALSRKYIGLEMNKRVRTQFEKWGDKPFSREQTDYGATDVVALFTIYDAQLKHLQDLSLTRTAQLEFDAVIPTAEMEYNGVLLAKAPWIKLADRTAKQIQDLTAIIRDELAPVLPQPDLFGFIDVNLDAKQQIKGYLSRLGIELPDIIIFGIYLFLLHRDSKTIFHEFAR